MSRRLILPLPGEEALAAELARGLPGDLGVLEHRAFPDGESYLRLACDVGGRDVVLVRSLAEPDPKFLPLAFAARTARTLGAASVTLVAPYLAYMRQDRAFHPGEAVTSEVFAALLSAEVDRLITVDPHLHRHHALDEIFTSPAQALHAAPLLAAWIAANVADPLVVGPDAESAQWAQAIAGDAPCVVLEKTRRGDREVEIRFPDLAPWRGRTPVLVDDVASSGRTLIEAAGGLIARGFPPPVCAVVHPIFAGRSYAELSATAARVVSTDTIPHPSNAISIAPLVLAALAA
jgi:ribose-phosphate pyrophosphokinase